ncbi:MAG: hypothetical protein ACLSG5_08185 [Oscillospiraceae bacterium]
MITPITKRDRASYLERLVFMAALLIPAVFRGGFRPLTVCACALSAACSQTGSAASCAA